MNNPKNHLELQLAIEYERDVLYPERAADMVAEALLQAELDGAGIAPAFHPLGPDLRDAMRPKRLKIRCGEYLKEEAMWRRVRESYHTKSVTSVRKPNGDVVTLDGRSIATILAALRFFSANRSADPEIDELFSDCFAETGSLSEDEIDNLCEQIDCSDACEAG